MFVAWLPYLNRRGVASLQCWNIIKWPFCKCKWPFCKCKLLILALINTWLSRQKTVNMLFIFSSQNNVVSQYYLHLCITDSRDRKVCCINWVNFWWRVTTSWQSRPKSIAFWHCTEVWFTSFSSTFVCISMYKQTELIFVPFWYLILTTLKEICGNLRLFE